MYRFLLAHAGETHETAVEATTHQLAWYIQLPLFLLAVAGLFVVLQVVTKKRSTSLLITASTLLVIGFGLYKVAPVVSATAITIGLAATLFMTLIGLEKETPKEK